MAGIHAEQMGLVPVLRILVRPVMIPFLQPAVSADVIGSQSGQAFARLHRKCGMSSTAVGKVLNRTHATVLYHCLAVDDWLRMPFLNMEAVKVVREVERLHGLTN